MVDGLSKRAREILFYAFINMLNNAIDHSDARELEVRFEGGVESVTFEIGDNGVGIFRRVRKGLHLPGELDAAAELSKGKVTTDPARHTGEGIFFTSRAALRFEAESGGLQWIVDNARGDVAIRESPAGTGTRIRVSVARKPARSLKQVFDKYTDDFQFTRTEIVVRLFEHGTEFVSRSEARRLLQGLEKFRRIKLDFSRVRGVGQGFADEVFRVWPAAHRGVRLLPVKMAAPVAFMVRRAARRA